MASPRSEQVDLSVTRYYHCMSRCVRRAFLCGEDRYSGQDYSHRKAWVRDRLRYLASIFAIDICAYAVMENHLHVVLAVDEERAQSWSEDEIVRRYTLLYPMAQVTYDAATVDLSVATGPAATGDRSTGDASKNDPADSRDSNPLLQTWRERLSDLSWMMRALNEYIARKANKEEKVQGRFWEGRFKSQALVDETGLLTAMAYVDLNPCRVGNADTLEEASFTSIQDRIAALAEASSVPSIQKATTGIGKRKGNATIAKRKKAGPCPKHLAPMQGEKNRGKRAGSIPLGLSNYIALLKWTGSTLSKGKRGKLASDPAGPALLQDQGISPDGFILALRDHRVETVRFLGSEESLEELAVDMNRRWLRGIGLARSLAPALVP